MNQPPQQFKRLKGLFSKEQNVLNDICARNDLKAHQLKPMHTDSMFIWEVIPEKIETEYEKKIEAQFQNWNI